MATPTDWRTEITQETRQQIVRSIYMMLKEQPSELNVKLISDRARKHEMNLFSTAKSKEEYLSTGTGKMIKRENHQGSSSGQAVVVYPQYHQPAEAKSLLLQHIQRTPQLHRQHPNVRQAHQQFAMQNQSGASPQNTSNSQCRPQGFPRQDTGIHLSSEMFTQHPNFVNLTTQVKKEVDSEGFMASKSSEQRKQHSMSGASADPERIPNSEVWHDAAFA